MAYATALTALADPTRQKLYERLRRRDHTVGELVGIARVSQPAVSQHLKVLKGARLVTCRRDGTRRYYRASREGLADLRRYVESLWDDVLEAFAADDPAPPTPAACADERRDAIPRTTAGRAARAACSSGWVHRRIR